MSKLTLRTLDGGTVPVPRERVEHLGAGLCGEVLSAGSPGYDEARRIWNAMIDRRPGIIARCAGAADVLHCMRFAREHRVLSSVRGGGHNIAGSAVCDGGLMIDLSPMRSVRVDPRGRVARVEPGATLGRFDREAQAFGLATPLGINSTTGVAGLTLGGGFGWLSRSYGLSIDNLLSVDVVTPGGELLHASGEENADLFWGVRGGGGNFGVVTSFEFRLHPVGPELLAGLVVYPYDDAAGLLGRYREFAAAAPEALTCWAVLRKAPPLPFLPAEAHGREMVAFAACWAGDPAAGRAQVEPLLGFGEPLGSHLGPMPYAAWQTTFDPLLTPGARNYWKSHNFTALDDGLLEVLAGAGGALPTPHTEIFVGQLGGATNRVPREATAYAQRDAAFVVNLHTRWEEPADDERCIGWSREVFDAAAPYATGGVYVNFVTGDEDRVAAAYGPNHARLVALKRRYDPDNLLRMNQNIAP